MNDLDDRPPASRARGLMRETASALCRAVARFSCDLAVWADVRAFPALAVLAGLDIVAGLVLLGERGGSPPFKLANGRLCFAALAAAFLTIASRWFLARVEPRRPALWMRALLAALSVLPLVALLSTATSRNSPWAISFVSALAVAAGNANLLWDRRRGIRQPAAATSTPFALVQSSLAAAVVNPVAAPARAADVVQKDLSDSSGKQAAGEWIERNLDQSGQVCLQGRIIVEFVAGQSVATAHVPFFPAFARIPEFSCEVIDAASVRPRSPAVYRYGARVEFKRGGDVSCAARVAVAIRAAAAASSSRAA